MMKQLLLSFLFILVFTSSGMAQYSKPFPGARIDHLAPINRGLVAWYLFSEGGGSGLTDIVNGYDASLVNMDANNWAGSIDGGAVDFDETNDHIQLPEKGEFPTLANGSFSLCCSAKIKDSANYRNLIRRDNFNNQGAESRTLVALSIIITTGNVSFTVQNGSGNSAVATIDIVDNKKHDFCAIFDAGNNDLYLYIDGILLASKLSVSIAGSPNTAREPWVIGSVNTVFFGNDLLGQVSDVRFYNRTLSASEVMALHNDPYFGILRHVRFYNSTPATTPASNNIPQIILFSQKLNMLFNNIGVIHGQR